MKTQISIFITSLLVVFCAIQLNAQEMVVPLQLNNAYLNTTLSQYKSNATRATLPFIDDFSYQGPYPDASLWEDSNAYINNTMSATPVTRGVATLDGLNKFGRPYYNQPFSTGLADSLTSQPLNLLSYNASNNIYLSFYYQPQGLGFAPESGDSLFLYFKNNANQWVRMWETRGTPLQQFKIILIPVTDAQFFHSTFQFRFVNIASLNTNDDVWNLDYIKLDANRNAADSILNDVAFTKDPSSILAPYRSMPYRHFTANQANEKTSLQNLEIRNLYGTNQTVTTNHIATELASSSAISSNALPNSSIVARSTLAQTNPTYNISYTAPNAQSKVVIRNQYFYPTVNSTDRKVNDTIVNDVVFDNYFAYDDGSAEKSYFLLPAANFPSKTALQFHTNISDTVRGLMVHFGAQVPTAAGKFFSIALYKSLGGTGQNDSIIAQEDLFQVQYEPTYNGFTSYAFSNPVVVDAGTYYMGITQPANFGSDSIYYGLDVNDSTNIQFLYYNVDGTWYASNTNASIMMRPILGQAFIPSNVVSYTKPSFAITLFPNPIHDVLFVETKEKIIQCDVFTMQGAYLATIPMNQNKLDLSSLKDGTYVVVFKNDKGVTSSRKIIKK